MAITNPLSPADRDVAIEHLVNRVIHLPGMPRAEVTRLKDQRTKLVATSGVLAGCRQRIVEASR
jgi:hypothetical protein